MLTQIALVIIRKDLQDIMNPLKKKNKKYLKNMVLTRQILQKLKRYKEKLPDKRKELKGGYKKHRKENKSSNKRKKLGMLNCKN